MKYLAVIMRADNHGEGGILSLVALIQQRFGTAEPWARRAVALGVLGAALFYCDALITPAISVLSAVEGLELLNPGFERAVLPVTLGVIVALFAIQRRGTARVGRLFGPIMILWFVALAVLGAMEILQAPQVLKAVNPWYAIRLFAAHPGLSLFILGAVFLVVTGAEALYADMGHFGRKPVGIGLAHAGVAGVAHQLLRSGRVAAAVDGRRLPILSTRWRRRRCCRRSCCCRPPRPSSHRRRRSRVHSQ